MAKESLIRVLLVEDHAVVREGLRQFLERTPDIRVTGEAIDVASALDVLCEHDWSLVMLDIALPGKSGMDGIRDLKASRPDVPILIFSGFSEEQYALDCLKLGASGYLNKDCEPDDIRTAIRRVARGERYVSPRLAVRLLDATTNGVKAPHEKLTGREFDIMLRISRGQGLTEIGHKLGLSVKTISSHRAHILEKMDLMTNAEIIRYVVMNNLDRR